MQRIRSKTGILALVLVLIVATAIWRVGLLPGLHYGERLFERLPNGVDGAAPSRDFVIVGDRYFWTASTTVYSLPLHGGTANEIYSGNHIVDSVITSKEAILLKSDGPKRLEMESPWRLIGQEEWNYSKHMGFKMTEGEYRLPASLDPANTIIKIFPRPTRHIKTTARLIQVPFSPDGNVGQAREMPVDLQGYYLDDIPHVLTAGGVYWVRPDTSSISFVLSTRNRQLYQGIAAGDTLMFTPLGGRAREVLRNCFLTDDWQRHPDLRSDDGAAHLREPGIYPQSTSAYYELSPNGAGTPMRLPVFPHSVRADAANGRDTSVTLEMVNQGSNRLRCGNRYYWLEGEEYRGEGVRGRHFAGIGNKFLPAAGPIRLMSMLADGTDVRVVSELRDIDNSGFEFFGTGEKLCLKYSRTEAAPTGNGKRRIYVATLPRDYAEDPLAKSVLIDESRPALGEPPSVTIEYAYNGYLYFTRLERQQNILDFLSDKATEKYASSFWRIKLPD